MTYNSEYKINDEVKINPDLLDKANLAKILGVKFTESQIYYDLLIKDNEGLIYTLKECHSSMVKGLKTDSQI